MERAFGLSSSRKWRANLPAPGPAFEAQVTSTLIRIGSLLSQEDDLRTRLRIILTEAAALLEADAGHIFLVDGEGRVVVWELYNVALHPRCGERDAPIQTLADSCPVMHDGVPMYVIASEDESGARSRYLNRKFREFIAVPLDGDFGSRTAGVLALYREQPFSYQPEHIRALQDINRNFAPALLASARAPHRGKLASLLVQLVQGANPEHLVRVIKNEFGAYAASIFWKERHGSRHYLLSTTSDELREAAAKYPKFYEPGKNLTGFVASGTALRLADTRDAAEQEKKAPGLNRREARHPEGVADGSRFLGVPIRVAGEVRGVLRLSRRLDECCFLESDQQTLQTVADILGQILHERADRALFRGIVESSPNPVIACDPHADDHHGEWRVVYANPAACRFYHLSVDQLIGSDGRKLFGAPDEPGRVRDALLRFESAQLDVMLAGHGAEEPVPTRLSVAKISGKACLNPRTITVGIASCVMDLRLLLRFCARTGLAFYASDSRGTPRFTSEAETQITGYSREKLGSMLRSELWNSEAERADFLQACRDAEDGVLIGYVAHLKDANGKDKYVETTTRVDHRDEGRFDLFGVYRDVTDQVEAEIRSFGKFNPRGLVSNQQLLDKLTREAAAGLSYVTTVRHQLTQPLSMMEATLTELIDSLAREGRESSSAERARAFSRQFSSILKNFSPLGSFDPTPSEVEETQIVELLDTCIKDIEQLGRDPKFEVDKPPRPLPRLKVNRTLVGQLLWNVLDNGVKYSEPGSPVSVKLREEDSFVLLSVRTRGCVIREEEKEQIFEAGMRGQAARLRELHGTGIGLWVAREILRRHRGDISLDLADEGRQATFHVRLPILRGRNR